MWAVDAGRQVASLLLQMSCISVYFDNNGVYRQTDKIKACRPEAFDLNFKQPKMVSLW